MTTLHYSNRAAVVRRVRAEYREIPGLQLTLRQAERFWGLDTTTCEIVFRTLLDEGFLEIRRSCPVKWWKLNRGCP